MSRSPLHERHVSLGARFTDFGAWEMPVQYEGVIAEHMTVRESVGIFDVSHLGRLLVEGHGATELLRHQLCNDVANVAPGRAQYTMALNDQGGVEDDIIVWRLGEESYWVLPNGGNFHEIVGRFFTDAPDEVQIEPLRDDTVLLAVQGPGAPAALEEVLGEAPKRFRTFQGEFAAHALWAAGTGYTGERGAEVAVPAEAGTALFDAFLATGARACGLGARDTLRLEMGYPLWGQDLDSETTPLEAGLEWVVDWEHEFVGREALVAQRDEGVGRALVAFRTDGRAIPRHGYQMRVGDSAGVVASGNFSPILECGIGMGYVSPAPGDGGVQVEIRGEWIDARRVDPPFIDH